MRGGLCMLDYETFMKHAAKVCESGHLSENVERYKILKGVKHLENGDAVATDSHRLYLGRGIHNRTDGAVITPKGKILDGSYPDVSRLINLGDPKQKVQLSVKDMLEAAGAIHSVGKLIDSDKNVRLKLIDNSIRYTSPIVNYYREFSVTFEIPLFLNARYLLEAMKLLKATGCERVTVNFYSSMRPVTFINENDDLLIIILPIRMR